MSDFFAFLKDAPVANLLILAGLAFLAVGVIGKIRAIVDPNPTARVMSGVLGVVLLVYGIHLHNDAKPTPPKSGTGAAAVPAATPSLTQPIPKAVPTRAQGKMVASAPPATVSATAHPAAPPARPFTANPVTAPADPATAPAPQMGWYGYKNDTSEQDRERELTAKCGAFTRVYVAGKEASFDALCQSLGMKCSSVCDWEGKRWSCSENTKWVPNGPPVSGRAGARIAYCMPK